MLEPLIGPLRRSVPPSLVENELVHYPATVHLESDLGVHNIQKIFSLSLREQLNFRLSVACAKRCSPSRVMVRTKFGANSYLPAYLSNSFESTVTALRLGGKECAPIQQRRLRIQQVQADIIDSRRR